MDDTGAHRGFVMAESGFQSGALEASCYTNVTLTSIRDLKEHLASEIATTKLRLLLGRVESCSERYWAISKSDRIEYGLRPGVGSHGYSSTVVIKAVELALHQGLYRGFPILYNRLEFALQAASGRVGMDPIDQDDGGVICTPSELYEVLDQEISELENLLDVVETALRTRIHPHESRPPTD